MTKASCSTVRYTWFLLSIAGLGGLLYGVDVGIIAAALLYLNKTIDLTVGQTSIIVAAVLGGGMISSPCAGILADWLGRKTMMLASGLIFILSVVLIVLAHGFPVLFLGRLVQGFSAGVIAVVVPLYLAESLPAERRGSGTAIFQFMLTVGIALASVAGWFYTRRAELAIAAAAGHPAIIRSAESAAWRSMFLAAIYPGIVFFLGSLALSESPRWLLLRGKAEAALAALRRSTSEESAAPAYEEMQAAASQNRKNGAGSTSSSLLKKKYVVPFVLACLILTFNQTTGINSILAFLVVILKQAGMSARHATQGDVAVKILNCAATIIAIALVEKRGRKYLLKLGTAGIVVALTAAGFLCLRFEANRTDVKDQVQRQVRGNSLAFALPASGQPDSPAMAMTVIYTYGAGSKIVTARSSDPDPELRIAPQTQSEPGRLVIEHAFYGPAPPEQAGWLIAACLALFIAAFAVGPGVVVWLALSELMPTRIRSIGMGIALLLNQGASTLIAGLFLPVAGNYGYHTIFFFWAGATACYFLTAVLWLPETRGKTLEEIERFFERA